MNNLTFKGVGSLSTGGADLSVSTARVTTTYDMRPAGPAGSAAAALAPIYTAPDYKVDAGTGTMTIASSGGTAGTAVTPGGTLEFEAGQIAVSTLIETPSAQLTLSATGNVSLAGGARLLALGSASAPGGVVTLTSTGGAVTVGSGASIDVSAGGQGDAGSISLYAPVGGVQVSGTLAGRAGTRADGTTGLGGSLSIVTSSLDIAGGVNTFSALNAKIGDFTQSLAIETSTGNITIADSDTVKATSVNITADTGSISLLGTIDASGPGQGGSVELYAGNNLTVSGSISAYGTGQNANGGSVTLGIAGGGTLALTSSGSIDVSGTGTGTAGTATFEAPLTGASYNRLNMSLNGTVTGASDIYADAMRTFAYNSPSLNLSTVYGSITGDPYLSAFLANPSNKAGLFAHLKYGTAQLHLQPSIVVTNKGGDINVDQDLDLSTVLYSGEPGTLTLRAAGNLNINGNLLCTPTYDNDGFDFSQLLSTNLMPSWSFNLVAGARMASPDLMAVMPAGSTERGNLTIGQWEMVYTEKGAIRFASAGDTVMNEGPEPGFMIFYMNYSLGTYSGPITGNVGGNLTINAGGAIQSATGSINIRVGGDLNMTEDYLSDLGGHSLGSIRTTGEQRTPGLTVYDYYDYSNGGGITLNVAGAVNGDLNPDAWLVVTQGQAVPVTPIIYNPTGSGIATEGIATMGGGSIYVRSGGSFNAQIGTFGAGQPPGLLRRGLNRPLPCGTGYGYALRHGKLRHAYAGLSGRHPEPAPVDRDGRRAGQRLRPGEHRARRGPEPQPGGLRRVGVVGQRLHAPIFSGPDRRHRRREPLRHGKLRAVRQLLHYRQQCDDQEYALAPFSGDLRRHGHQPDRRQVLHPSACPHG